VCVVRESVHLFLINMCVLQEISVKNMPVQPWPG